MTLHQVCEDIKKLKIQGAENIAFAALSAMDAVARDSKAKDQKEFIKELNEAREELISTRPNEPLMRNALSYVLSQVDVSDLNHFLKRKSNEEDNLTYLHTIAKLKQKVYSAIDQAETHLNNSKQIIQKYASKLIKEGMRIFTHCHSSTVIEVLKHAWKNGIGFEVWNTETRPLYQGRKTATELSKAGIPMNHFVDSYSDDALSVCNLMFIGADAITSRGEVINKVGSEMIAKIAKLHRIKVYVFADSWKSSHESIHRKEEIEQRDPKEVWETSLKGIDIFNPAFELINPRYISRIVSEVGIHKPKKFVKIMRKGLYI